MTPISNDGQIGILWGRPGSRGSAAGKLSTLERGRTATDSPQMTLSISWTQMVEPQWRYMLWAV